MLKDLNIASLLSLFGGFGKRYELTLDAWANDYTYDGYNVLCVFHNVVPLSENIFDGILETCNDVFIGLY